MPITKRMVWEAWLRVKSKGKSAGVDGVDLKAFEQDISKNLYKIWNRMASGSYFPAPVKRVLIPKANGKMRPLGIPTVADRVAQTVVKMYLEPQIDPIFHRNSYGYRPNRSAHQALEKCRQMCKRFEWVVDLDIKGFFDQIDHELLLKALRRHTQDKWVLMYVERWLKAPVKTPEGLIEENTSGTPQGGVISPLLANLFLHYALDKWLEMKYPYIEFERFADDCVIHCPSRPQAERIMEAVSQRMQQVKLELNLEKTHIAYCKNFARKQNWKMVCFTFLGFTFRPRKSMGKYGIFLGFDLGISNAAKKSIRYDLRRLQLHRRTQTNIEALAELLNPKTRGWINYFGKFRPYHLSTLWEGINDILSKWAAKTFKRFNRSVKKAREWLRVCYRKQPKLFAHWSAMGGSP